jgi:hypothetical protein
VSGPTECNTGTHNSRPPNATGSIKVVLNKCLVQQNVIQVHITPVLQMLLYKYLVQQNEIQVHITPGPVACGGRELCVLVLHSAGPDIYLKAFGGRELYVLVLHSAGPGTYLTLL